MANKIDSNITGLRYAEETSMKTLPGSPVWYPLEPNSYSDFGGQLSTVVRKPISSSRQQKKGAITDLEASGGFNQDLTQTNLTRLLQGVFFADIREKGTNISYCPGAGTAADFAITGVLTSDDSYNKAADTIHFGDRGILASSLIYCQGFTNAGNNGLKLVSTVADAKVVVGSNLTDEPSPPATAKYDVVGYQFAVSTCALVEDGANALPYLNRASGTVDWTTLGLVPGEWVYVGGDSSASMYFDSTHRGWARVNAVTVSRITFDKTSWTPTTGVVAGTLTIQLFFGKVLKNESTAALIKRRTYHLERSLGADANGTMYEYLIGASPNEFTLNISQADKITVDLSFVAVDNAQYTGTQSAGGLHPGNAGTKPAIVNTDCFNTSNDFSRIKLSLVSSASAAPSALFAYATELSINIKNNVSANKAVGTLGAFDTTAGVFEVGGNLTAYFADVTAVQAVRNNSDVTLDICIARANAGIALDIPLMSLGDGRLNIAMDEAITLPLEIHGAESSFGHTILMSFFPYLPTIAES